METLNDIERERQRRGELTPTMEAWLIQRTIQAVQKEEN
jgi:hypothetical protein